MWPDRFRASIGVVLGSGLGPAVAGFPRVAELPFHEVPGMPGAGVPGHQGSFALVEVGGEPVLAMVGRVHLYEGHPARAVTAGIRALAAAGVRGVLLTNAAGGIRPGLVPGSLVRLEDHINLTGTSPLEGGHDFLDMTDCYDPALGGLLDESARDCGVAMTTGVYAAMRGPQYETPAEIRMLRALGADVVGMSTVLEAIEARARGLRVAGLSCVTNLAAGIGGGALRHDEVVQTGREATGRLARLLAAFLPRAVRMLPG